MAKWDVFDEVSQILIEMGGSGSGFKGHKGIKGQKGGSAPGGRDNLSTTALKSLKSSGTLIGNVGNFTLKTEGGSRNANLWITPGGDMYQVKEHGAIGSEFELGEFPGFGPLLRLGWGRAGYMTPGQAFIDTKNKDHALLVLSGIKRQRAVSTYAWVPGAPTDVPPSNQRVGPSIESVITD